VSTTDLPVPALLAEEKPRFFVVDAFTNPAHLQFALRGCLAALTAYVIYTSIDWPGLSTALATCIITALSTIGASRQKQFLRLSGALIGGIVFGMGAQIFILPHLDSIVGFSVLFMVVTAISAWISTATPRLSYLGLQLALAFYLINLQEFTIQTSLAIARDRVFGILLGLVSMWLIFDRLWVRDALQEMISAFSHNLRLLADLSEAPSRQQDPQQAMQRLLTLREQINNGFNAVKSQSDAVLFEFGPTRQRKLKIRADFKRWQPTLGTLLQVQVTYAQYLLDNFPVNLIPPIAAAQAAFQKDMAAITRSLADEVSQKASSPAPDLQQSAARLRQEVQQHYGSAIPARAADIVTLTQNLALILAPLYIDIHAEFQGLGAT
jgi:multidrug resistance protein MdtO